MYNFRRGGLHRAAPAQVRRRTRQRKATAAPAVVNQGPARKQGGAPSLPLSGQLDGDRALYMGPRPSNRQSKPFISDDKEKKKERNLAFLCEAVHSITMVKK